MCIILVVAATDEGLSAGGQALGRLVLMLGYRPQGHLAHEGVAPLILLVWPRLMHKHHQILWWNHKTNLDVKHINDSDGCRPYGSLVPSNKNMYGIVEIWSLNMPEACKA